MEKINPIRRLVDIIKENLPRENIEPINLALDGYRAEDIALALPFLEEEEKTIIFNLLPLEKKAVVLEETDDSTERIILKGLPASSLSPILSSMPHDNAADVLIRLPKEKRERVLSFISRDERKELNKLLTYGSETAGGIMNDTFISVKKDMNVGEVVERIRNFDTSKITRFSVYVTDQEEGFLGMLPLKNLLLSEANTPVSKILKKDIIKVGVGMDQEEVAGIVSRYNLLGVPVVDSQNRLVGTISSDDVIDVIREETDEDIYRMVGSSEDELINNSVFNISRIRLPWLLAALGGSLIPVAIISAFRDTLKQMLPLAFFMPVILAMAGNLGTQSSTIIIRGLATGRVNLMRVGNVVFREMRVGVMIGFACGLGVGVVARIFQGDPMLGLVVGSSMIFSLIVAATIGTLIPLILKWIGVDPAVAAGPFVTTSNDILGLLIYFGIATLMLHHLVK